jgi:hypothetical protein
MGSEMSEKYIKGNKVVETLYSNNYKYDIVRVKGFFSDGFIIYQDGEYYDGEYKSLRAAVEAVRRLF